MLEWSARDLSNAPSNVHNGHKCACPRTYKHKRLSAVFIGLYTGAWRCVLTEDNLYHNLSEFYLTHFYNTNKTSNTIFMYVMNNSLQILKSWIAYLLRHYIIIDLLIFILRHVVPQSLQQTASITCCCN